MDLPCHHRKANLRKCSPLLSLGEVSPELIGQHAEICAIYARTVDLFTQLQTYKHMSVSSIPVSICFEVT